MTSRSPGSEASDLESVLAPLVSGRGRVGSLSIDARHVPSMTAAEASIVEQAVPRRQAEFATGRSLLRHLLADDVEILRMPNGAPALPRGVVGSLAHDRELVIAAIASSDAVRALGIDVEPVHDLDDRVAELIVRPDDVAPDALTAFVAKEAAYKVWSVLGGDMLEHRDVNVIVDGGRYRADLRGEMMVDGEIGHAVGRVMAVVVIPAT